MFIAKKAKIIDIGEWKKEHGLEENVQPESTADVFTSFLLQGNPEGLRKMFEIPTNE